VCRTASGASDISYDIKCSKKIAQPRPSLLSWNRGSSAGNCHRHHLRLDRSLIDQHDGDIVLHGVDPVALRALEAFRALSVLEWPLAGWTNQHFQEFFGNHDSALYDRRWNKTYDEAHRGR